MCGIVGYVGARPALDVVVEGLRRLEYRGYDSAGVALTGPDGLFVEKRAGKLAHLEKALTETNSPASTTGIGHTRWATHGAPNDVNAHPHLGGTGQLAVVHNGIIENFDLSGQSSKPVATSWYRKPTRRSRPSCLSWRWAPASTSPQRCAR